MKELAETDTAKQKTNSVKFVIPIRMPVSVNSLYQIIYSQRRVELKPEAWQWKSRAKEYMPPWKPQSKESLICIDAVFFYNFYCKNGELRNYDTPNLHKLLIDTIASRYGFSDRRVKCCPIDSHHSENERTIVVVSEYFDDYKEERTISGDLQLAGAQPC